MRDRDRARDRDRERELKSVLVRGVGVRGVGEWRLVRHLVALWHALTLAVLDCLLELQDETGKKVEIKGLLDPALHAIVANLQVIHY